MFNPPVSIEDIRPLDEERWQGVSPRYATQLRISLVIYWLVFSAVAWLALALGTTGGGWHWLVVLVLAVVFTGAIAVWVPRRVRHTRYLLRLRDMHMQTGLLWRRTTSVAINRIQHLEITQGPVERLLGLSRLVLYTAGGMKSDLVLPGLITDIARRLKVQILKTAELDAQQDEANESASE
ncbi:MAG: PH domain-containing protein [Cellvibrionaceae bacterium]